MNYRITTATITRRGFAKAAASAALAGTGFALAACGGNTDAGASAGSDAVVADGAYTIGICQLVQHEALDAATNGFIDKLTELCGEGNVSFDNQNASGDTANCATIINGFVSSGVDLIMANATPALQAAAAATDTIPVLGTSITEYGVALDIEGFDGTVGNNISGTSDLAPLDQQAAMVQELFPEAKTVGLLYCTAEANSIYQIDTIEGYLTDLGLTCERFSFTDTNDVAAVVQSACDVADVIYIPTDNTAASNTETIANVVIPAGVPVIAGEEGICAGCGVATLSISYSNLGATTGEMAYRILAEGEDITTMAIEYDANPVKKYNAANAEALGVVIPDDYQAIEVEE